MAVAAKLARRFGSDDSKKKDPLKVNTLRTAAGASSYHSRSRPHAERPAANGEVSCFLERSGISHLASTLLAHGWDEMELLQDMEDKHMHELKISAEDISQLRAALAGLQAQDAAAAFAASRMKRQFRMPVDLGARVNLNALDKKQARALKASWKQIQKDDRQKLGETLQHMQQIFSQTHPGAAAAVYMDWPAVTKAIGHAVDSLDDLGKASLKLRRLGSKHASLGTQEHQLHQMRSVFMMALRTFFVTGFDADLEVAWSRVFDFVLESMVQGLLEGLPAEEATMQWPARETLPKVSMCPFMQSMSMGREMPPQSGRGSACNVIADLQFPADNASMDKDSKRMIALTSAQETALKQSWKDLQRDDCKELSEIFGRLAYEFVPDTAAAAGMDWSAVVKVFGFVVERLDSLEAARTKLERLGANHAAWGTKEHHLHDMRIPFLMSLETLFGSQVLQHAWGEVYDFVAQAMVDGLSRASASPLLGQSQPSNSSLRIPSLQSRCPFKHGGDPRADSEGHCQDSDFAPTLLTSFRAEKSEAQPTETSIFLSEGQTAVLKQSWQQIQQDDCQKLGSCLCEHFYQGRPEAKMATRMDWAQVIKALGSVVDNLEDLDKSRSKLTKLGKQHGSWGTKAHQFYDLKFSLLRAIQATTVADFGTDLEIAWSRVYDFVSAAMLDGLAQAAP